MLALYIILGFVAVLMAINFIEFGRVPDPREFQTRSLLFTP